MAVMLVLVMLVMTLYCMGSVGIIWLICELMGWPFSISMAVGVWFLTNLVIGILKKAVKRNDRE